MVFSFFSPFFFFLLLVSIPAPFAAFLPPSHVPLLTEEPFHEEPVPLPPVEEMRASVEALLKSNFEHWHTECNSILRMNGYPALHVNEKRDKSAYLHCPCDGSKKCFKVTLERVEAKGAKKGQFWRAKKIGDRSTTCQPVEPSAAAQAALFIPPRVKLELIRCYDAGINVNDAFERSKVGVAGDEEVPLTWNKDSVKNFFDRLARFKNEEIVSVLDALGKQGHHVQIDVTERPGGARILNRFFVASVTQQELFRLFGKYVCTLDSTYGKNKWNYPLQFFVGVTNEHKLISFGCGGMRSERYEDFLWLMHAFCRCYDTLPLCMIVDGDPSISKAIYMVATEIKMEVVIFLCIWHLLQALLRALQQKGVKVLDEIKLKKDLHGLQRCPSQEEFDAKWDKFLKRYGTTDKARSYLEDSLFEKRHQWAHHATGKIFSATLSASSISESWHALLASGKSHGNKLHEILLLVDKIMIEQLQKSRDLSDRWEREISFLTLGTGLGFAGVAVSGLLSGKGWSLLKEKFEHSLYFSMTPIQADHPFERAFCVEDGRFPRNRHTVQVEPFPGLGRDADPGITWCLNTVKAALSKDMNLGVDLCSLCGHQDPPGKGEALPFVLPPRWELLYQGNYRLKRLVVALGFGLPKEENSTNNLTTDGLTCVLLEYEQYVEECLNKGMSHDDARASASEKMAEFQYGGRFLGRPRVSGLWMQCGVLEGEKVVPDEHKASYCGKWYHFACTGLQRDSAERIQCLQCLQDARFRPKTAPIDHVVEACMYSANGVPRIIEDDPKSSVRTLHLVCDCSDSVIDGAPCEGMLVVARTLGAVISFHSFSPHWWSSKLLKIPTIEPIFEASKRHLLDIGTILEKKETISAPSRRDESMRAPLEPHVMERGVEFYYESFIVTEQGYELDEGEDFDLEGVHIQPVSRRKHSRRHKPKKHKQNE